MDNLMRILMLGVVMFALSSVPAPVDQTLERDGVSAELFELNSAPATVGDPQGLGGAIVGLVLTPPLAAQNGGGGGDCEDFCIKDPEEKIVGTWCEHFPHAPLGEEDARYHSGPWQDCGWQTPVIDDRQTCIALWGVDTDECYDCEHEDPEPCDPWGNGGDLQQGPTASRVLPSGFVAVEAWERPVPSIDGVLRSRCHGWALGVLARKQGTGRILI
jgi:hypothetical protein